MLNQVQGLSGDEAALLSGYRAQKQLQTGAKHDPFSGTPTGPYSHGQYGLFNMPGSLRSIFSAVMTGESLAMDLPVLQGLYNRESWNSSVGISTLMTGVTKGELDTWSNQPTEKCAEPPKGGLIKMCSIVNPYGKVWGGTEKVDITEIGEITHRDEPIGFNIMNNPMQGSPLVPSNIAGGNSLEIEIYRRTWESVFTFLRLMEPLVYTANPSVTAASQNAKQWQGLDLWINQNNKRDMLTSNVCTAANSVIFNANFESIDDNPVGIYRQLEEVYRHCKYNARMQRLEPCTIKMVCQEDLFKKLTRSVPVTEHLHALVTMVRSNEFTSGRINIDASSATALGQQMYRERWIPIDGDMVPVVVDTYINELDVTTNGNLQPGEFASDVYFVPYTVMGGIPVTGWDFKNFNNPDVNASSQLFNSIKTWSVEDGGKSMWLRYENTGCIQLAYVTMPRLIMLTPQIAGRLQNVAYTPLLHTRSWDPDDSQYYLNGGRTNGDANSFYNSWSTDPSVIGSR